MSPQHKGFKCLNKDERISISKDIPFNECKPPYSALFPSGTNNLQRTNSSLPILLTQTVGMPRFSPPNTSKFDSSFPINNNVVIVGPNDELVSGDISNDVSLSPFNSHHFVGMNISLVLDASSNELSPNISVVNFMTFFHVHEVPIGEHVPTIQGVSIHNTHLMLTRVKTCHSKPKACITVIEPIPFKEDLSSPQSKSMKLEYIALLDDKTWSLTTLRAHINFVG